MKAKLSILFFFISYICFAQQFQLSQQSEISVLTVGQGDNLNDAFGHSAFRIKDKTRNFDVVYDYGRYDFNTPNFYLKFVQGKLNYLIGKRRYSDFFETYRFYDRTIEEQKLNLSQKQKQKLYNYLLNNYKPENRAYLYDFFYDNCATRIRDVLNATTNNSIVYDVLDTKEKSFRDLIHRNVGHNTWGSFGIDIALGSLVDKVATGNEQMFLPEYINKHFDNAALGNSNLTKTKTTVYKSRHFKSYKTPLFISPIVVMSLIGLLIIYITYRNYKSNTISKWIDVSLFVITGLSGLLLLFLWFGTDHTSTGYNYNLLWAFPLNLFVVGQLFKKIPKDWFRSYIKFLIIMLCLMSLHWIIGVQTFAIAFLPILIALIVRFTYLTYFYKPE